MARKNRRDCRVGERKKREASQRASAAVTAIKKSKKAGTLGAKPGDAAPPLSSAAASFLAAMKDEVAKTTQALVEDVERRTAPPPS
ncbi:hypothetical protein AB1Y20_012077 [Prymnesium parvum]|uniref:Ribosome biogenesis protein NOP53 n=1 Tax=Prymnesium parvum TaxID=97485 RepID=A0AB34INC7_PRYPA